LVDKYLYLTVVSPPFLGSPDLYPFNSSVKRFYPPTLSWSTQTSCILIRRQAGGPVELPTDEGQNTNTAVTLGGQLKLLLTKLGKVDTDL
jgi:hypothetical protein